VRVLSRSFVVVAASLLLALVASCRSAPAPGPVMESEAMTKYQAKPEDVVRPQGLPEIGKWMLDADLTPAHWLGEIYYGKSLREPINVIIVDGVANSAEEAKKKLVETCSIASYPSREGHSSGYRGYIGGQLYAQLPEGKDHAFSNGPFEFNNNHGRIFGPYFHDGSYLFIGAFSREKVEPLASVKHQFVSFNQARDDFAGNVDRKTDYRISGYVNLNNMIVGDPSVTTGDHDGMAVLITAGKQTWGRRSHG